MIKTDAELFANMEAGLVGRFKERRGPDDVVAVRTSLYLKRQYVEDTLTHLRARAHVVLAGLDEFTPLERFALAALVDAAGIDIRDVQVPKLPIRPGKMGY